MTVDPRANARLPKTTLWRWGKSFVDDLFERTKQRALEVALSEALGILGASSEQNYRLLPGIFDRFARDPGQKMIAEWVREYMSPGKPGAEYLKRILTTVHPNIRRKYIARFIAYIVFHPMGTMSSLSDGREVPMPACMLISPSMRCSLKCVGCYAGNYTSPAVSRVKTMIRQSSDVEGKRCAFCLYSLVTAVGRDYAICHWLSPSDWRWWRPDWTATRYAFSICASKTA